MQPKGREFSNEFKLGRFANGKFDYQIVTMMAYITEYHDSKFATDYSAVWPSCKIKPAPSFSSLQVLHSDYFLNVEFFGRYPQNQKVLNTGNTTHFMW